MSPCWSSEAAGHNIRLQFIHGGRKREFGESIKKNYKEWGSGVFMGMRKDDDGWIIREKRYQD